MRQLALLISTCVLGIVGVSHVANQPGSASVQPVAIHQEDAKATPKTLTQSDFAIPNAPIQSTNKLAKPSTAKPRLPQKPKTKLATPSAFAKPNPNVPLGGNGFAPPVQSLPPKQFVPKPKNLGSPTSLRNPGPPISSHGFPASNPIRFPDQTLPPRQSNFNQSTNFSSPQPAHPPKPQTGWLFRIDESTIVQAESCEPFSLVVQTSYGEVTLEHDDIVSFRIVSADEKAKKPSVDSPNAFSAVQPPQISALPKSTEETLDELLDESENETAAETLEEIADVLQEPIEEDKSVFVVVALAAGDIVSGKCELPEIELNLSWGTAKLAPEKLDFASNRKHGLKTIVNAPAAQSWLVSGIALTIRSIHISDPRTGSRLAPGGLKRIR